MEKTFYLTDTGKKVTYGETIEHTMSAEGFKSKTVAVLSEYTEEFLKAMGIISDKPVKPEILLTDVIASIAKRVGWCYKKMESHILKTAKIMPMAAFNILIKEIAIMLDDRYPGTINNSEEIYVISTFNGKVVKAKKDNIVNYKNFAAFRTVEDAETARCILKSLIVRMFGEE